MAYKVRIFFWNGEKGSQYMGQHDIARQPVIGGTLEFGEPGRIYSAHVMTIAPANWDPTTALIPSVHVTGWQPTQPALKEEKRRQPVPSAGRMQR